MGGSIPTTKSAARAPIILALASAFAFAAPASADDVIRADLRPGQLVRDGAVGVVVPPPGHAVRADVRLTSGDETFAAVTRRDGTVVLRDVGSEAADDDPSPAVEPPVETLAAADSPHECEDGAYRRGVFDFGGTRKFAKWKSIYPWWFRASTAPADVGVDPARSSIRRAIANIVGAHNECGMPDNVTATQDYQGDTTTGPNINVEGTACLTPDTVNVVAFGTLPEGALAGTCAWAQDDGGTYARIYASDIRINKQVYRWYGTKPDDCADRWSIEGVMTHEFGHTYGLGHVDDATHRNLTMSNGANGACLDDEASLGKGDIWGLLSLY